MLQNKKELSFLRRMSVNYGLHKRCRLVLAYRARGRLLDVGCGSGQFLDAMRRQPGWSVVGVDTSPTAVSTAREMLGLEVYLSDLNNAPLSPASFDVVTMWDVLEHLHDPVGALSKIKTLLKPDGVLLVRTPSLDSWDAALFGRCWAGLDPPRHLVVFSRYTLYYTLQQGGFKVIGQHPGGGGYAVLLLSLRIALGIKPQSPGVRQLLQRMLEHPIANACLALPLWLLERTGKGAEMCFVAKPQE
jgi:SAM-dependent methyltransferase